MTTLAASRSHIQRLVIVLALFVGLAWGVGGFVGSSEVDVVQAVLIVGLLGILSLVVFWLAARSDPEGTTLFVVLFVSFALKLAASYYRAATGLFADAHVYYNAGVGIAVQLARGEWPELSRYAGTGLMRLAAGVALFVAGDTFLGVTFLWAWFALIGMLLFYKAFVTAFPDGNRRLYLFLVLLFPSLLLWTGSLGKDAPMMFFGGMAAYGLARSRRALGIAGVGLLVAGIAGMFALRPHMGAALTVAVGASFVIHPVSAGRMTPAVRLTTLVTFGAVAIVVAIVGSRLVGLESLELGDIQEFIGARQGHLSAVGESGASAFTPVDTKSPLGLAILIPTVLFRPFPWEAHNRNALITSLEGLCLIALMGYRFRSVRAAIVGAAQNPFLLTSVLYVLGVIYLFSAFANFGIIARQRVQIFPFVFMWIAYLAQDRRPEGN